jgi:hypothetical protein
MKLTRLQGLIVQNLAMASGHNFLWSGHGSPRHGRNPTCHLSQRSK